jgi:hypothetical protein
MGQIEYLTAMLYGQLGLTEEVMNGTADEKAMLNYWNRTIEPVLTAIVESMRRTFLTKTARTQRQNSVLSRIHFLVQLRTLLRFRHYPNELCLRMNASGDWFVSITIEADQLTTICLKEVSTSWVTVENSVFEFSGGLCFD